MLELRLKHSNVNFFKLNTLLLFCLFSVNTIAQLNHYSFEQIDSLQQIEARPVVIFIQTDWCQYCKAMEQTTFQNKTIIEQLNSDFYFINFNGEEERDITFRGHIFKFKPTGHHTGVHELAEQLGSINGKLSFPTLCILNEDDEIIFQYGAFLKVKDLKQVLKGI